MIYKNVEIWVFFIFKPSKWASISGQNINVLVILTDKISQIIKECTIEGISRYLIKEGNKRDFPDITTRQ